MIIAIAGPYSAATAEERQTNLDRLNLAVVQVLALGHTPLIGVNAALPVVEKLKAGENNIAVMQISMALLRACDALLFIAESPGANKERDWFIEKGLPVYHDIRDIPEFFDQ